MGLATGFITYADATARNAATVTSAMVDNQACCRLTSDGTMHVAVARGAGASKWLKLVPGTPANGFVEAIATSVDNEIARFNGTTGQIQGYTSDGPTISDTGDVTMGSGKTVDGKDIGALLTNISTAFVATTYTPTFTAGTNTTGAGTQTGRGQYVRIGNTVIGYASVLDVAHTAGAPTASTFELSVPVASNFAATTDLHGTVSGVNVVVGGLASGSVANDRLVATYSAAASGNLTIECVFIYQVI